MIQTPNTKAGKGNRGPKQVTVGAEVSGRRQIVIPVAASGVND